MKLNLRNPLCFFDLEATGMNVTQDRIVEIAVVKMMPNGDIMRKQHRLNPEMPIPPASSVVHGIYDDDVKDAPTFKEVAKEYARFFEGADLAGFALFKLDMPLLVEEFLRAGVEFDYSRKKMIDAQKIFHLMEKRTLSAAYQFYCGKPMDHAHNAMSDTEATLEVLLAQVQRYEGQDVTDTLGKKIGMISNDMESLNKISASDLVDLAGRMTRNEKGVEVFNFGKHKSKPVTQVFQEEPAYYEWMMNGDFPMDTKRKLTDIKLRALKSKF